MGSLDNNRNGRVLQVKGGILATLNPSLETELETKNPRSLILRQCVFAEVVLTLTAPCTTLLARGNNAAGRKEASVA